MGFDFIFTNNLNILMDMYCLRWLVKHYDNKFTQNYVATDILEILNYCDT